MRIKVIKANEAAGNPAKATKRDAAKVSNREIVRKRDELLRDARLNKAIARGEFARIFGGRN